MRFLTDFADQAVIIPLMVATAVALAVQGWRRGAAVWLAVVSATLAATLVLKFMFLACAPLADPLDVHSPSGHVAAATVVAGGLAAMITRRRSSVFQAALLTACLIGLSRLVLGMHTLPEVIVGGLIGMTGVAALVRFAGPPPRPQLRPLIAVAVIIACLFHGLHFPAEAAIRHSALRAALFIPACRA